MTRKAFPDWYCAGCQKHHPVSVWIEAGDGGGAEKWCGPSVRRAIREGRNYLPRFHTELTPIGEQLVIPGCERNLSPKAKQLDLF